MPYFKDAEDLYATLGRLFRELTADQDLAPRLRRADTVIQYVYRDPDCQITASLRPGEESRVDFGATELEPEVTMSAAADVAHRFWLGRLNLTLAIARGEIETAGPVDKILALAPVAGSIFPRYRQLLEAAGRRDLAEL